MVGGGPYRGAGVDLVGAAQEVLVLAPGNHGFRQLPQVQFEQRCHRVDVSVTAGRNNDFNYSKQTFSERYGLAPVKLDDQ